MGRVQSLWRRQTCSVSVLFANGKSTSLVKRAAARATLCRPPSFVFSAGPKANLPPGDLLSNTDSDTLLDDSHNSSRECKQCATSDPNITSVNRVSDLPSLLANRSCALSFV